MSAADKTKLNGLVNGNSYSTITKSVSGGSMDNATCVKADGITSVAARIYNINVAAGGVFFNIPNGYRPVYTVRGFGYMAVDNTYIPLLCVIDKDNGNVTLAYSTSKTTTQVGFCATYYSG